MTPRSSDAHADVAGREGKPRKWLRSTKSSSYELANQAGKQIDTDGKKLALYGSDAAARYVIWIIHK